MAAVAAHDSADDCVKGNHSRKVHPEERDWATKDIPFGDVSAARWAMDVETVMQKLSVDCTLARLQEWATRQACSQAQQQDTLCSAGHQEQGTAVAAKSASLNTLAVDICKLNTTAPTATTVLKKFNEHE